MLFNRLAEGPWASKSLHGSWVNIT